MYKNGSTTEFQGYCIDLIDELSKLMSFEYEIYEAPDKKYGNMNEAEEWDGLVKELVDKNADIGLGALAVMAERENVVDFTVPYYDLVGITILMKKPKVSGPEKGGHSSFLTEGVVQYYQLATFFIHAQNNEKSGIKKRHSAFNVLKYCLQINLGIIQASTLEFLTRKKFGILLLVQDVARLTGASLLLSSLSLGPDLAVQVLERFGGQRLGMHLGRLLRDQVRPIIHVFQ